MTILEICHHIILFLTRKFYSCINNGGNTISVSEYQIGNEINRKLNKQIQWWPKVCYILCKGPPYNKYSVLLATTVFIRLRKCFLLLLVFISYSYFPHLKYISKCAAFRVSVQDACCEETGFVTQQALKHSLEFPIGYCHKVKIGWTFTKMVVDHTIL